MPRSSRSPASSLLRILQDTGYVSNGAEMGRLLRIEAKNIHRYLQPEGARWRISPKLETLAQWCWALSQSTGLSLRLLIDSSGELDIEVSGYSAAGNPLSTQLYNTNYRRCDAAPLASWGVEWAEFLERFQRYYVERSQIDAE